MTFVLYAALVVLASLGIGASLLRQDRNKREEERLQNQLQTAQAALGMEDIPSQHAAVNEMLDAFEPVFFKSVRGWSFYAQLALGVLLLAGGLLALGWGMEGALSEWQVHHASSCRGQVQPSCIVRIPGTVVGSYTGGHDNELDVHTTAGTEGLRMWGDIHPVHVGERVQVEKLGGTAIYLDTHEGRIEVDNYWTQIAFGVIGLILVVGAPFVLYMAVRQRSYFIEWQEAREDFERGGPGGIVDQTTDAASLDAQTR